LLPDIQNIRQFSAATLTSDQKPIGKSGGKVGKTIAKIAATEG
jgi:hypothetical protein